MTRRYDHIDLRVHSLAEAGPFYEALLPPLGFTRRVTIEDELRRLDVERRVRREPAHEPGGERELEVDRECDQVLLDLVVERTLDSSAFAVCRGGDARSRRTELLELTPQPLD